MGREENCMMSGGWIESVEAGEASRNRNSLLYAWDAYHIHGQERNYGMIKATLGQVPDATTSLCSFHARRMKAGFVLAHIVPVLAKPRSSHRLSTEFVFSNILFAGYRKYK